MNANTDTIGSWSGILLDRARRLPATLARVARVLGRRIAAVDAPFHSRMGSWETKVSPAAQAAMQAMRQRGELKGTDGGQ